MIAALQQKQRATTAHVIRDYSEGGKTLDVTTTPPIASATPAVAPATPQQQNHINKAQPALALAMP